MTKVIKLALVESGVDSLENLAAKAKVERTRLVRIANGRVAPRPEEVQRIARALRTDAERLFPPAAPTGEATHVAV